MCLNKPILASACCLWLAVTQFAKADAIGIKTINKSPACAGAGANNLITCNVYVQFDTPTDDLTTILFADVTTNDPMGFFQHPFGNNYAPNADLCAFFPELCCDSFVTIGCKTSLCPPRGAGYDIGGSRVLRQLQFQQ